MREGGKIKGKEEGGKGGEEREMEWSPKNGKRRKEGRKDGKRQK